MAKARPFTYNNGSPIEGTAQLGNLSIGVASLDYSKRPGNKTWWMGPDEENQYVIIKDVPTQDWPTPIGNIGSIRFWNSNQKTDSAFISMTNALPARNGQTAFTTVRECTDWLSANGYWSNYPITNEPFSTFTVIRYPDSVAANGETGSFFHIIK